MEPLVSIGLAAGIAAVIGAVAVLDHRWLRASRRTLLSDCVSGLSASTLVHGADDFPRLEGFREGRRVRVELIPDTMTIRRLPQLWLSVTVMHSGRTGADLAVLVRPSGNDFYSMTEHLKHSLRPPKEFPWEVLARGSGARAQALLDRLAHPISAILADPRVKEIAITSKGYRIIRQAGEGRRGEHLLLRQAVFDNAAVKSSDLEQLLKALDGLSLRLGEHDREVDAA